METDRLHGTSAASADWWPVTNGLSLERVGVPIEDVISRERRDDASAFRERSRHQDGPGHRAAVDGQLHGVGPGWPPGVNHWGAGARGARDERLQHRAHTRTGRIAVAA